MNIVSEDYVPQKRKTDTLQLLNHLEEYREWLLQLTICDPACGSGAFLNQALEFLIDEHQDIDAMKARLFGDALMMSDVETSILENNLYGVDINEEATDIAKLSLWLRTARKGRKLNDLNSHIKCGNSLIDDPAIAGDKSFNWQMEFPEVFAKGGFDVVIGNPPYVTGSLLSDSSNFLRSKYKTAQYQLDLYILFIELSINIVSERGIVSFITPNSWLKNLMMSACRKFLLDETNLLSIVPNMPNVFADANVDSSIFALTKVKKIDSKIGVYEYIQNDFTFKHPVRQDNFIKNDNYVFSVELDSVLQEIIDRVRLNTMEAGNILDVVRGINPYDIYTGQSKEVIESKAYHSSYKKDPTFVPELRGKHVSRYGYQWDMESFISYGEWLAAPRNPKYFTGKRLLFREILGKNFVCTYIEEDFKIDRSLYIALHVNDEFDCKYVLAILASKLMAFYFRFVNNEFDALFPKIRVAEFKKLPIKRIAFECQLPFVHKVELMLKSKEQLLEVEQGLLSLLKAKYGTGNNVKKLQNWPNLTFKEFLNELKKQKIKLALLEQSEWMQYFESEKVKANAIRGQISKTDREIESMVYELYGLTEDEIRIVEGVKS